MKDLSLDELGLTLTPEGGALAGQGTVYVADLHLGKSAAFRRLGCPVPEGATAVTLQRLSSLLGRLEARRVVVLGDLWHDDVEADRLSAEVLREWRSRHRALEVALVPGNHDRCFRALARELGIEELPHEELDGRFLLRHRPSCDPPHNAFELCGHVHPAYRTPAGCFPCFWLSPARLVLPAFGEFTGGRRIDLGPDERAFITTGTLVCEATESRVRGSRRQTRQW